MNITEVKIRATYNEGRMRALVSITIDSSLAVHDIKIIEGPERFFVAMPSRREENGTFRDIIHPITAETRQVIEHTILKAYDEYMNNLKNEEDKTEIDINNNSYDIVE